MLNRIMVEWVNEWMHEYALFRLHQFNSTDHWCFSFLEDSFFKLYIDAFQSSLFIMHTVKPRGSRYIFIHSLDSNIWFTHDGMCELRGRKWICIAQILKMFPCRKQNGTWACMLTHTHTHTQPPQIYKERSEWRGQMYVLPQALISPSMASGHLPVGSLTQSL